MITSSWAQRSLKIPFAKLRELPARDEQIIRMLHLGYERAKIAAHFSISVDRVNQLIRRAVLRLE